jgi:hypothetical protein
MTIHKRPRRFVRRFAAALMLGLGLVAGSNFLVNPWGLYSTRLVEACVADDRYRKCALLRQLAPPPQQMVLGSSRMMRYEPRYLERKTGLRTFNAAVLGAVPVDCLALYRYAVEAASPGGALPLRSVIIGVDTLAFFGCEGSYRALAANAELRPFLPAGASGPPDISRWSLLLSQAQTLDSWASLGHAVGLQGRRKEAWRELDADGFLRRNFQDADWSRGHGDAALAARYMLISDYLNPGAEDPRAAADLDRLLELLQRRQVRTTVVVTPTLRPAFEQWQRTGFIGRERGACDRIRRLAAAHGARFVDFSAVESFKGDPREFYDLVHPTLTTTRKMVDALFPESDVGR